MIADILLALIVAFSINLAVIGSFAELFFSTGISYYRSMGLLSCLLYALGVLCYSFHLTYRHSFVDCAYLVEPYACVAKADDYSSAQDLVLCHSDTSQVRLYICTFCVLVQRGSNACISYITYHVVEQGNELVSELMIARMIFM